MADNIVKNFKDLSKVLDEVNEKMEKTSVIYSDMNSSKKGSKVQTGYFNSLKKEITGFDSYIEKAKKSVREFQKTVKDPNASNNLRISYNMLANAGKKFADVQELINRNASKNKIGKAYKDAEAYLSKALNKIFNFNVALEKNGRDADSLVPRFKKLATAFGTAFSLRTLVNFGKKVAEVRGEFELQQRALQAIVQNKQLADEIWEKTMKAALQSPFTAMQLTRYTKQLAAYRIENEKLFETTKRLADVSAGLGVDMQRLILAYGQVKAANYLRASEIRQFTEAGVNILGELSNYLTETRGKMISTADVMQMVQKRLIGFKDVEEIFRRLTDQGGIFYNMQYIQSQTLKGQINKLHDAYDQMLNSIGKSDEGLLKGIVSTLNSIVKNWSTWAAIIKGIGFGTLVMFLTRLSSALGILSVEGVKASKAMTRLSESIKRVFSNLAANPASGIAAGIALVIGLIAGLTRRMNEANKAIDEQILRLYEEKSNFADLKSKIEENNKVISSGEKDTKKLSKAQKSNQEILQRLKNDYPDLAAQMDIATNSIINMNNALDIQNRIMSNTMTLLALGRQDSLFSDDLPKNIQEAESELAEMRAGVISIIAKARQEIAKLEAEGTTSGEKYEAYKQIEQFKVSKDALADMKELVRLTERLGVNKEFGLFGRMANFTPYNVGNVRETIEEYSDTYKKMYEDIIAANADYQKEINEKYGGSIEAFMKENAERINKDTKDGVNQANQVLIKALGPQTEEMKTYLNILLNNIFGYVTSEKVAKLPSLLAQNLIKGSKEGALKALKEITGVDFFSTKEGGNTTPEPITDADKKNKIDAAWRRRIQLLQEMKRRYDELSQSAYGYAKSEAEVREAFKDSFREIFEKNPLGMRSIKMEEIDFTTMESMSKSFRLMLERSKGISDAIKEELLKLIDSFDAQVAVSVQVQKLDNFKKQIEDAFGEYEVSLEVKKLDLPADTLESLFDTQSVNLSDLRFKVARFYQENFVAGEDNKKLVEAVEGYYKKIDDMQRKQQRERIKEYAKYLEYELSEKAKLEMEYAKRYAEVSSSTMFSEDQKQRILNNLKKEYDKKIAKQGWEDFKGSEMYVEMMEDLEHHGLGALQLMRQELERIRDNAENLTPRALKEVVNAIEKINEIEVKRSGPIGGIVQSKKNLDNAWLGLAAAGINPDEVKTQEQARQMQEDLQRRILLGEQELRDLNAKLGVEENIVKAEKDRYENQKKLNEQFGDTFSDDSALQAQIATTTSNIEESKGRIAKYEEQIKTADEKQQKIIGQQLADEKTNQECLEGELNLLKEEETLRALIKALRTDDTNLTDSERESLMKQIEELEAELKALRKQEQAVNRVSKAWEKLWQNSYKGVSQIAQWLKDIQSSAKGLADALGADTTSGIWAYSDAASKGFGAVQNVMEQLASGNTIGAIVAGATGLMDTIAAFAGAHDADLEAEIKEQQQRIESLQHAYARLEKQIEKTWDTTRYMEFYNAQVRNINEQIAATRAQVEAEEDKKDTDEDKVRGYKNSLDELYDKLDEIEQKQIEVFGGIGETGYRSAAEGFVDAWKDAFLETGDGLDALQDHFDEFLQEWFVKQATMRIAGNMLQNVFEEIDKAVDRDSVGGANVTLEELQRVRDLWATIAPDLNEALTNFAGMWDLNSEGGLSGLAAGIQGMTEEQANILEAYWNSVRINTANIDQNVSRIADILGAGGVNTNPQLEELQSIRNKVNQIYDLFSPMDATAGSATSGHGLRVYVANA